MARGRGRASKPQVPPGGRGRALVPVSTVRILMHIFSSTIDLL